MSDFSDLVGLIDQSLLGQSIRRMTERENVEKKKRIAEIRKKIKQYTRLVKEWNEKLEQANRNP